jgi:TP901 family phage tail tape measure protein
MSEIRNETGLFAERAVNQFGKIGQSLNTLGRTLTYTVTAPLAVFAASSAQAAMAFERNMNNVNSIAKMSAGELASLGETFLKIGSNSIFGAEQTSAAGYEIFSAGVTDSAMAAEILAVSVKVAEANLSDLGATTKAINATIAAFDMNQEDATRVGNVWTRMVQLGVGSMDDFLSNAQKILPLAKEVGLTFEELGATVAFASQGGGGAAKAETAVAQTISNLLRPNLTMMEAFADIGVENAKQLLQKFGGLAPALMELKRVGKDAFPKMFAKSGLEAVLRLTANIDKTTASMTEFNKGLDTATQSAWDEQAKGTEFQLRRLGAAFEGVRVIIGQAVLPILTPFIEGLQNIMQTIMALNPQVVQFGVIFMAAVAALPPLIWALGSALSLVLSPIGLVVGAIGGLSVAFATNLGGVRDILAGIIGDFSGVQAALEIFMAGFGADYGADYGREASVAAGEDSADAFKNAIQITLDRDTSPYQLWLDNYEGTMTWPDFQEQLKLEGWTGGALLEGTSVTIFSDGTLQTAAETTMTEMEAAWAAAAKPKWVRPDPVGFEDVGGAAGSSADALTGWDKLKKGDMTPAAPAKLTFFDKLANGFTAAWPVLETALNGIWENIKLWFTDTLLPTFDGWGGDMLNRIGASFSTTGSSGRGDGTIYQAIRGLFTGDLTQASGDLGKWLQETFPNIGEGLSGLFTSIGNWILKEGVPSAARIGGFLSGTLLGGIINGIDILFKALNGLLSSGGDASAVGAYIQDSVFTPMQEGFTEGFTATGAGTVVESFGSSIVSSIVDAATNLGAIADKVATAASAVGNAILGAFKDFFTGDDAVQNVAGSMGLLLAGAAASLSVAPLLSGIGTAIGGAFSASILATILPTITTLIGGIVAVLSPIAIPLLAIAAGIAGIIALATNEDVQKGFEGWGTAISVTFTIIGEAIRTVWGDIQAFFFKVTAEFLKLEATALRLMSFVDPSRADQAATAEFQVQGIDMAQQVRDQLKAMGGKGGTLEVNGLSWALTNMGLGGVGGDNAANTVVQTLLDTLPNPELLDRELQDALQNGEYANIEVMMPLKFAALTEGMSAEDAKLAVKEWIEDSISANQFSDAAKEIFDAYLKGVLPTVVFPEEGTGVTSVEKSSTTIKAVADQALMLDASMATTAVNSALISSDITSMSVPLDDITANMSLAATSSTTYADEMERAEASLTRMSTMTLPVTPEATGTEPDGTHAAGLTRVPFDGYMAQLHKGERVLTAAEASQFNAASTMGYNTPSTSVQTTTNNISISGVQDVDRLLQELKRRGIYVNR